MWITAEVLPSTAGVSVTGTVSALEGVVFHQGENRCVVGQQSAFYVDHPLTLLIGLVERERGRNILRKGVEKVSERSTVTSNKYLNPKQSTPPNYYANIAPMCDINLPPLAKMSDWDFLGSGIGCKTSRKPYALRRGQ